MLVPITTTATASTCSATSPGERFHIGVALTVNSGAPYRITAGRDDNQDGPANDRPPGVPRNSRMGPGFVGLDVRASRDFYLEAKKEKALCSRRRWMPSMFRIG